MPYFAAEIIQRFQSAPCHGIVSTQDHLKILAVIIDPRRDLFACSLVEDLIDVRPVLVFFAVLVAVFVCISVVGVFISLQRKK
jgi:hypothetical protein